MAADRTNVQFQEPYQFHNQCLTANGGRMAVVSMELCGDKDVRPADQLWNMTSEGKICSVGSGQCLRWMTWFYPGIPPLLSSKGQGVDPALGSGIIFQLEGDNPMRIFSNVAGHNYPNVSKAYLCSRFPAVLTSEVSFLDSRQPPNCLDSATSEGWVIANTTYEN